MRIINIDLWSKFREVRERHLLSSNCDGSHGGNSKGENVELHFDDRLKVKGIEVVERLKKVVEKVKRFFALAFVKDSGIAMVLKSVTDRWIEKKKKRKSQIDDE